MTSDNLKDKDLTEFDLDRAVKSVDSYSVSTGVRTIIIDIHGSRLHESCSNTGICDFCTHIENMGRIRNLCSNAHLYGSYQAERFGGKYIYFCPLGFTFWASPITPYGMDGTDGTGGMGSTGGTGGTMKGAIVCGPVQMIEPEQFLFEEILRKYELGQKEINAIMEFIHNIPIIKPDVVNNLSELLHIVAVYISGIRQENHTDNVPHSEIVRYINYYKTMGGDMGGQEYPIEKEKELLRLISLGDKAGSQKVLNEIFGYIFFSTGGNFEIIKARVLELVVLLSRAALEGGADVEQIFGLNYSYLSEINKFDTVDELTYWLSEIMARFTDLVFNLTGVKHVDVIFKAIEYVKNNYMKKVTLEEVASKVYLTPSYFSKIFKEEMKYNFNTYLNHIRIEVAKKLLLDESVPLVDVSSIVGYEDQSYFSKVFKKMSGISPGKFRESRGQAKPA